MRATPACANATGSMTNMVAAYLDHNASAPLLAEARDAVIAALDLPGNPSSVHGSGRALRKIVDDARDAVAELAGAEAKQVVFTGSATEALTQAIVGGAKAFNVDRIVYCATDHTATSKAAEATGLPVTMLPVDSAGSIDIETLASTLEAADGSGETLLVSFAWVNNETGVIQPRGRIEALVGPSRHLLVIDAVQAFGKLTLDFAASATDMIAVSGHKIGAPAGIGALLVKSHCDNVRLVPGGGQEQGRRGGTEPVALIAGFGKACEAYPASYERAGVAVLGETLETGLKGMDSEVVIFGEGAERIGNCVNFAVPGIKNTVSMMALDLAGIALSSGSACSSGKVGKSHVLAAMGVTPELSECGLRVSFGWSSTAKDVELFLEAFEKVLSRHRAKSGAAA